MTNLVDHITDIQDGIRTGRFVNEASISQGIILRLLQALGWPTFDTQIVCPEYILSALLHAASEASITLKNGAGVGTCAWRTAHFWLKRERHHRVCQAQGS